MLRLLPVLPVLMLAAHTKAIERVSDRIQAALTLGSRKQEKEGEQLVEGKASRSERASPFVGPAATRGHKITHELFPQHLEQLWQLASGATRA